MTISFDLDSTLIPNGKEFESEYRSIIAKFLGIELIRKGSSTLIQDLQNSGHQINIYTTSFRSQRKIRWTLRYYGIEVHRIVNEKENRRELKARNIYASKYPPAFQFNIHIDDSKGVQLESERLNFQAIIIEPSNTDWVEHIKAEVKILEKLFLDE